MRVCLIPPADLSLESGSTLHSRELIRELGRRGHDVAVVCSKAAPHTEASWLIAPIPLPHPYDDDQKSPGSLFYASLKTTLDAMLPGLVRGSWDVVHAIYPSFPGVAAALTSTLFGIPSVVSCFGRILNLAAHLDPRYRAMAAATFAGIDCAVAASPSIANTIVDDYSLDAARVVSLPMPIALEEIELAPSPPFAAPGSSKAIEIVSICSCLTAEKGVEDVISAIARTLVRAPDLRLHYTVIGPDPLAGSPYAARLTALAREAGMDGFQLTGFVPHAQIGAHISRADLLIDARRVANFSSVVVESAALGAPMIVSHEAASSLIEDGISGLRFPAGDSATLSTLIEHCARKPELRAALGRAAQQRLESQRGRFEYSGYVRALEEVYRLVLSRGPRCSQSDGCALEPDDAAGDAPARLQAAMRGPQEARES